MKVLSVFGYFRLPNDFGGTLSDALRAMAEYHETDGLNNPNRIVQTAAERDDPTPAERWADFWDSCKKDRRIDADMSVAEVADP